ncbi:MAG: DUF547 domain-containing protein [Gammaproteobacteria bacterium]
MGLALGWASGPAAAAPKAELQPYWDRSDAANPATVDHSLWQGLLDGYLDTRHPSGVHRFAYGAVRSADGAVLRAYLTALQALDPRRYPRPEQEAYWINLYNALTVDLVLARYPVKSIREIGGSWLAPGPWDDAVAKVAGRALSLNDIEHGILRPIWRDPRIHYAVNCASIGCPNLAGRAYTRENLEGLLEEGARDYVNHPRGAAWQDGELRASSIYDWYQEDFGGTAAGVLDHLLRYARPELAQHLPGHAGPIDYEYDWSLNEP